MQNALKREIKRLSRRMLERADSLSLKDQKHRARFQKRTGKIPGLPKPKTRFRPKHFDPIYCARNANFLSKTIWHKVLSGTYEVTPAIHFELDKPGGGKRPIMAFSIPDAALANVTMYRSRERNLKKLSSSSFAYRPDKNLFDAIIELLSFEHGEKLFAVQIDFEKFFDTIPSRYIKVQMDNQDRISLTPHERFVYQKFLHHQYAKPDQYKIKSFKRRHRGTPQGSSASLFLANLANNELDILLDAEAGKFVRFADDVIALCNSYEQAQQVEKCFYDHCDVSGLAVNQNKSPGTAIISNYEQEIRTYDGFDYLGYSFQSSGLTIPAKSIARLKSKISRLLNLYLCYYLRDGFNKTRTGNSPLKFDWDLLGFIYELRLSVYGGLSEKNLKDFIDNKKELPKMRGLMGFYCLIEDPSALKEIDGWILSQTRRAMSKRNKILNSKYSVSCPVPSNKALATGEWIDLAAWRGKQYPDARVPSLVRGWRAARKHYYNYGLEDVQPPKYGMYNDMSDLFNY